MNDDRRVIVIGSGPSGAMAALALLKRGIPVTMLESGETPPPGLLVRAMGKNLYRRWPDLAGPQGHTASGDFRAQWHNALVPGGLSNNWVGAVPRFAPEDFFEGERLHERYRWPLTYGDLVPYYEQVERLMRIVADRRDVPGLPGPRVAYEQRLPGQWQQVASSAASFGQGLTPLPIADGPPWLISRSSAAAFNSFTRIVPLLQRSPHFQLLLGAHAMHLEWSGRKRMVDAVVYIDRATRAQKRVAGAAVIVAAGPLASTKLLLSSTSHDFPEGLGNTDGLLGRYLHDHSQGWCVIDTDRALPRFGQSAYLTRPPYRESPPLLAASCTLGRSDSTRREKLLSLASLPAHSFGVVSFGTMVPVPENCVRLNPTATDGLGLPLLDVHISYHGEEVCAVTAAQGRLVAILEAAGYRCKLRDHVLKPPGASVHYAGTVRMHSSPSYGMLNGWNRLHAVDNVVVADASCFTTGVEKNPTLTAMALAARASHRLAEDVKTGTIGLVGAHT